MNNVEFQVLIKIKCIFSNCLQIDIIVLIDLNRSILLQQEYVHNGRILRRRKFLLK